MGGAHSLRGEVLEASSLGSSWLVDCAGDIDPSYRQATGRWLACVFPDLEGPLESSERISGVVRDVVDALVLGNGAAPERVYVMCQHGMNRSGLVSGLILRGLGFDQVETIRLIQAARPGALANDYFRKVLES
jgi:protein-tyrosine phosphatase